MLFMLHVHDGVTSKGCAAGLVRVLLRLYSCLYSIGRALFEVHNRIDEGDLYDFDIQRR